MKPTILKIRSFLIQHVVIFNIIVTLLSLYWLRKAYSGDIGLDILITNIRGKLPMSIVLILILALLGQLSGRFRRDGFFKGLLIGWPLLLIGIVYFFILLSGMNLTTYFRYATCGKFIAIIFDMFCIGLYEELLSRGVLFQSMTQKWGSDLKGCKKSMLISSIMFGLMHLMNYSPERIIMTGCQVIYASFIGMFLCSIFIRTKRNLWVVIALHAIFDLITLTLQQQFVYQSAAQTSVHDWPILLAIGVIAATFPLVLFSFRNLNQTFKDTRIH